MADIQHQLGPVKLQCLTEESPPGLRYIPELNNTNNSVLESLLCCKCGE
ncbi:3232_t:CDS:2 [Diversispora eburnea]|uniref:3232_t:CDS:1 n=1 Tax=Diversispora eburnea TaxID=1213867 RepID=A0A9N8ZYL2_9GLOM|nr:3232_t:CDS:2 [Diversispora eburnea]